ncbi:MAG: DUF3987 domain-containing protein [Muribaculaceae bacterium]|nr:DUF3987 domain-containing protein [Muribaculaceae bacterium]
MKNTSYCDKGNVASNLSTNRVASLPIDGLPESMQNIIKSYEGLYRCPREFLVASLFSVVSTIVGNRVHVTDGIYTNSLSLWWVNIAPSGSNKTMPVKSMIKPLVNIDKILYANYRQKLCEWKQGSENGPRPHYMTLLVGDMTEESRHTILKDNPNGVLGYYPEIKGFFDDLDRYNKSGAISRVLRLWDNDPIKVTRKGDPDPLVIDRPFMNILGDLQPTLLKETFGSKTFMHSGLTQRFLFCYPENVDFPQRDREVLQGALSDTLEAWIKYLYNNHYDDGRAIISNDTINFSIESCKAYDEYYNKLQHLKASAPDDYSASVYSKAQIQVMRLAGIVHIIKALCYTDFDFDVVYDDCVKYAIRCMDYFVACAFKVYDQIKDDGALAAAKGMTDAELLRQFAKRFDVTNGSQLARLVGKSQPYVCRVLNSGRNTTPSLKETSVESVPDAPCE